MSQDWQDELFPDEIEEEAPVLNAAFHPTQPLIANAVVNGRLNVYRYSVEHNELVHSLKRHTEAVRDVGFNHDGTETAAPIKTLRTAHEYAARSCCLPLSVLCHYVGVSKIHGYLSFSSSLRPYSLVSGNTVVSGDDHGVVKLWDSRNMECIATFDEQEDYISDLEVVHRKRVVLATSADSSLGVYDLRKNKMRAVSEGQGDELLSCAVIKNDSTVVCGSGTGMLGLFKWGEWDDARDLFPGHPQSIDTIVKLDEDTVFTGSSDGIIRIVQIHPNQLLGIVGEHSRYPLECIAVSGDKTYLASCSHDNFVRFWNIAYLYEQDSDEEDGQSMTVGGGGDGFVSDSDEGMEVAAQSDEDGDGEAANFGMGGFVDDALLEEIENEEDLMLEGRDDESDGDDSSDFSATSSEAHPADMVFGTVLGAPPPGTAERELTPAERRVEQRRHKKKTTRRRFLGGID